MAEIAAGSGARADPRDRWELARGLLHGFENRAAGTRPTVEGRPGDRVLPVAEPLARLLPAGGLRRGTTVAVSEGAGSTSLLLALLAELSTDGAWVGVVGRPELGVVAAAEAGLRLDRLALVPRPGADLLAVTSALLDGLDVVVVAGAERAGIRAADRQRLAARARQRGAVLVPQGHWPAADLELSCDDARWYGPSRGRSGGCGRLRSRRLRVRVHGRGIAPGGVDTRLLLPAPGGGIADGAEIRTLAPDLLTDLDRSPDETPESGPGVPADTGDRAAGGRGCARPVVRVAG